MLKNYNALSFNWTTATIDKKYFILFKYYNNQTCIIIQNSWLGKVLKSFQLSGIKSCRHPILPNLKLLLLYANI